MIVRGKDIPGATGYYAGEDGTIHSTRRGEPYQLKPSLINGYPVVWIRQNGEGKVIEVHRLILEAFIGPRPEGMECCHRNGIKTDNRLSNLEWNTHKENTRYAIEQGTFSRGERHGFSKLRNADIPTIRKMLREGMKIRTIAKHFGVGENAISHIKHRRNWGWLKDE
jgi:hypothetical protein